MIFQQNFYFLKMIKFSTHFFLILALLSIIVNIQSCKLEGFPCLSTRECCPNLRCNPRDFKCSNPFSCHGLGQFCISDINCCAPNRCHPSRQRCVRSIDGCQQLGDFCDGGLRCCSPLTCRSDQCIIESSP